jgi:hypothetical protein
VSFKKRAPRAIKEIKKFAELSMVSKHFRGDSPLQHAAPSSDAFPDNTARFPFM